VREDAKQRRVNAAIFLLVTLVASTALIAVVGVLLWRGLRRSVLEPVESLAAQTRAVASGNLDRRILPSGPPEIEALGEDVDAMRSRIAAELALVESARAELVARTEDLARSNADLEQFAYVASHDLSEPLRKVASFCQLLERQYGDQLDDKARQYIAFAVDGARRMQILIGDLLDFSRVGRSTETFGPIDLDAVVARASANLEQLMADSQAELVRTPLPTVRGDATLLVALFQNLIGNSVKYRGPDPPLIEISAVHDEGQWLFTVSDNGIGIDPKYGERIFAIFQRLHLRDEYGGTGIGLALCRKIVEFHGGRIWLADGPGPGATFRFTLPDGPGKLVEIAR
jgi:light-regulated signal transduction histidine kinase (bacteriophytochrome)